MTRHVRRLAIATFLAVAVWLPAPLGADDEKPEPPKKVAATLEVAIDESQATLTGRYGLKLTFLPTEDIHRPYRIELRVVQNMTQLAALDHAPTPPTTRWKKGKPVQYEIDVPIPIEAAMRPGSTLALYLGFYDPELDRAVPPTSAAVALEGRARIARLTVPDLGPLDDPALLHGLIERTKELAAEGKKADAWSALELGIRRSEEDATKYRLRDALVGLGAFPPRPISVVEQQIVAARIERERRRYLRLMSGRYFDRGKLFAALRILESIGGKLEEQSEEAVIGAVNEAQRTEKDMQDIRMRIFRQITDEEKAEADKVKTTQKPKAQLEKARAWFDAGEYPKARWVLRGLVIAGDRELAIASRTLMDEVEAKWLAETPEDEAKLVADAVNHPAFQRIAAVPSQNFIHIGPRTLVETIPQQSRLRFDLSYIFQTDLFGRVPNPGGDRVTVFFKELWDFGGGVGGGKTIDIGKADPDRKGYRIDNGLLYHELTHCIDDTNPIFAGHREGLANFGAAYSFEALGQKGDELHAFKVNLDAFEKDYLARDLPYWRIQNYGPSAGFFLHFAEAHAKTKQGHDWKPYRKFFREYRTAPVRDGREPYVARALAYYLVRAFGPGAFDDLLRFRFPLVESDREAVVKEIEAFARGEWEATQQAKELEAYPNSPLPRDVWARAMISLRNSGRLDEVRRISQYELGILHDWMVIGPFESKGADPRAHVFPPEHEIDYAKEYPGGSNVCKWRKAGETGLVGINATGWVSFNFNYMDNTATYALTHVTVEDDTEAVIHVRTDDDFSLFVNDRLVDRYLDRGRNASSLFWWRGPVERVPDAMRLPVTLEKGRNKIFLKVKNRAGDAGFVLAVAQPNGRPVPGLTTDLQPPDAVARKRLGKGQWKVAIKHNFRTKAFGSKLKTTVGTFKVENQVLKGLDTDKRVPWRKYTVRPGFPKDAPSNLCWINPKHTDGVDAFRLTLDLAPAKGGQPKLVVTFQGEGERDGLSGWNLILHPRGKGKVGARLERYDNLVYQTVPLEHPGGEVQSLVMTYEDERLTVTLDAVELFRDVSITPIRKRHAIGFATFGPSPGIAGFKLQVPR